MRYTYREVCARPGLKLGPRDRVAGVLQPPPRVMGPTLYLVERSVPFASRLRAPRGSRS